MGKNKAYLFISKTTFQVAAGIPMHMISFSLPGLLSYYRGRSKRSETAKPL